MTIDEAAKDIKEFIAEQTKILKAAQSTGLASLVGYALLIAIAFIVLSVLLIGAVDEAKLITLRLGLILVMVGVTVIFFSSFTRLIDAKRSEAVTTANAGERFWLAFQELAKSAPIAVVGLLLVWMGLAAFGVSIPVPGGD